jgi:CheY-like chemotaxis protein
MSFKYGKVLIIDDTDLDRMIAEKLMQKCSFAQHVASVGSAKAGLDYLSTLNGDDIPELIFLDVHMPGMTGFEFLKEHHALPEGIKRKNIVVLTSSLQPTDRQKALSDPYVLKFITKPLSITALENL